MMTFSINIGQNTETTSYQLTGLLDGPYFDDLIKRLPDNQDKIIEPRDIRDSILSVWSSTVFKLTKSDFSTVPYIGIDTLNPGGNDIVDKKFLIGKKEYLGEDIIDDGLIDSDYDIIISNTKNDNQQQQTTRVSILSGTNNFINSPFIQSQILFGTSSISFDFISSDDIHLESDSIIINEQKLPISASASDGKVIYWNSSEDSMVFDDLVSQYPSNIGTSSQPLNIFGNPTNVNGYDLNFTDERRSPIEIGDIKFGDTFSDSSISEMLQRMIYQYLPPSSSIRLLSPHESGYVEFGVLPSVSLEFSIFKRTLNTNIATLSNMIPGTYPAITTTGYQSITATASGLITAPLNTSGVTFSVTVSDGTQSQASSTNIRGIYPYFHGFLASASVNTSSLIQLNKLVEDKSDKNIIIQPGSGFYYFIYDSDYPDLDEILDNNDNPITSGITSSVVTMSSPSGLWVNKDFKVYRIQNLTVNTPKIYKFKY